MTPPRSGPSTGPESRSTDKESGEPGLSVVVETANTPPGDYRELDLTLRALNQQTLGRDGFELLVVADPMMHPDLSRHLTEVDPDARMIEAPGLHYYAQKNRGAREARGRIIAFMDSDCVPVRTWARAIVDAFDAGDEQLGAVQGTVRSERTALGFAFVVTNFGHLQARHPRPTHGLSGNNCAFRRQDFLARPFDESMVFHGPDVEMSARMREAGLGVLLLPDAANHHHFLPGFNLFWAHGVYWGYCFLTARRGGRRVPHGRLVRALGPVAPLALIPAKAFLDIWRLITRRAALEVGLANGVICALALLINSLAVGIGAARAVAGLAAPTAPTSSNNHLATLPRVTSGVGGPRSGQGM